jgi:hypothetical protein
VKENRMITKADLCVLLGMSDSELGDPIESPAGVVVDSVCDGNRYIVVADDTPDADGKTGVMYLAAPAVEGGYRGDFPVYANFPDEEVAADEVVADEPVAPKGRRGSKPAAEAAS